MGFSTSGPVVNPGAMGVYNSQLGQMTANYNNILSQYGQAQTNAGNQLNSIYAGYGDLGKNIAGLAKQGYDLGAQDIKSGADQTLGRLQSGAASAGFTSTAQLALQNQAQGLAGRNYANLAYGITNEADQRQTQIGLAGLQARQQGVGMQTDLTRSLMGNLAGYNFAPKVDLYGQHSYSSNPTGGGGYGGGGGGYGTQSGGSPFSGWLMNSGVPGYTGTAPNSYGYAGAYQQPNYGNQGLGGYGGGVSDSDLLGGFAAGGF